MVKCPFCQFENEEGALFCEQCKSDLGATESMSAASPALAVATPVIPDASPIVAEAMPAAAEPVIAEAGPLVEPIAEAQPVFEAAPAAVEPVAVAAPAAPPMEQAAAPATPAAGLPDGAAPKLVVIRGVKINIEYPLYDGQNFIGRSDEKPVDIDLEDQEPPDRIWSSRQHAVISFENGVLSLEDLNSSNGTFVNRTRVYPGQKRVLNINDVIQIGTVQLKLKT